MTSKRGISNTQHNYAQFDVYLHKEGLGLKEPLTVVIQSKFSNVILG